MRCFKDQKKTKKLIMEKKNTFVLIFVLTVSFTYHLFGSAMDSKNFDFVAGCLSDSLAVEFNNGEAVEVVCDESSAYTDLFLAVNSKWIAEKKINVEKSGVKIVYIPYRKFPFFKKKWIRKAYFKGWIWYGKNKEIRQLINYTFEDKINQNPSQLENENWEWTIGKELKDKEKILPVAVEPILAIGTSLAIILSLFYVRS